MTTITPTAGLTIDLQLTLTSPLHHGSGSSGNTALLRTHEIATHDGQHTRVPFLSANSIRHGLREAIAWHTVHTLGIPDGSLPKGIVDLLWSGGAVTTTGAQTDLDLARRIDQLYPALGMLGYAAQSDITAGTLRVSDMEVVCRENRGRMPSHLQASKEAEKSAAAYRTEEFGTRHDIASTPAGRLIDAARDATGTQMIYTIQALKTGTLMYGNISLTPAATPEHERILHAALNLWAPDGVAHLGAKTAVGYGRARVRALNTDAQETADSLAWWTQHLTDHATPIRDLLTEIVG